MRPPSNSCGFSAGEATSSRPSAVTNFSAAICVARLPNAMPVPCVPVLVAPAIDCTLMSPRFSIASPRCASAAPSAYRRVPACTRAMFVRVSTSMTPCSLSSDTMTPSLATSGLNEWPAPTMRTGVPSRAASASNCAS